MKPITLLLAAGTSTAQPVQLDEDTIPDVHVRPSFRQTIS